MNHSPTDADRASPRPFFVKAGEPPAGPRLLLISYAFPPDSSIGALRWEKMLVYAAERGWGADVLSMDPADASPRDDSRLAVLPAGTRVFAVPLTPHPWFSGERAIRRVVRRLSQTKRGNGPDDAVVVVPQKPREGDRSLGGRLRTLRRSQLAWLYYDEWRRWCDRATVLGTQLTRSNPYAAIISCGPPQMAHEAGRRLASLTTLPFVMDLRDPWSGPSAEPWDLVSPTWRRLTARYERACVERAALVVANTAMLEGDLRTRYPALGDRFMTVMNGADPEVGSTRPLAERFTLIHAGGLYNGRDPRSLLRGLRRAIDLLDATPDRIQLRFLGAEQYEGTHLRQLATDAGVAAYTLAEAKVPRSDALRALEESAVLVILPQNQAECIPGKVFEYVQMSSWLLTIAAPGTATDQLLRETEADVVAPDDIDGIARIIARRFRDFNQWIRPSRVNADGRFDRRREAARLFDALEHLVLPTPARIGDRSA